MFYQNIFRQIFSINSIIFFRSRDTKTSDLIEVKCSEYVLIKYILFSSILVTAIKYKNSLVF